MTDIIETDEEVAFYQDKFRGECLKMYASLSPDEQFDVDAGVMNIYITLKSLNKDADITFDDVLVTVLSALYYKKFNESPIQTAIFSPHKE